MDLEISRQVFSLIPKPNTSNIEKIYEYSDLKNSLTSRELEVLKLMTEGKTDKRIERHYHTDSNSFERNVNRIITGPNVSTSTFEKELEKLSEKMLVKRR